jgi:HEAT repeat protein
MKKGLLILAVAAAVLLLAAGGIALWQRLRRPDLATALAEARRAQRTPTPELVGTPAPTPTPGVALLERQLAGDALPLQYSAAMALGERDDIPAVQRADLLWAALQAEADEPSTDAPRLRDAYLEAHEMYRLRLVRSLGALGPDALPAAQAALAEADGLAREHLLVALAYLGDADVLPEVRALAVDADDPVVRMDAARALGVAGDRGAIEALTAALDDEHCLDARDSLGAYVICPVRDQAAGALGALGLEVACHGDGTCTVEGAP